MKSFLYTSFIGLAICLVACAMPQKSKFDLYELRPVAVPADNDAIYVAPVMTHCNYSLSEGPSCGGI